MAIAGTDTRWGCDAHAAMRHAGLARVQAQFWSRSWHGGEPGCRVPYTVSAQLRANLIYAGMDPADIDAFRALLRDPRLVIAGIAAVSTSGRRR